MKPLFAISLLLLGTGCASTSISVRTPQAKIYRFVTQADVADVELTFPDGTHLHMVGVNHSLPSKTIGDNIAKDLGALGIAVAGASNFLLPH